MDKIIALRISLLLMKSRKRQKDLAAYLGVTDNTISYFVSGKRTPNIEQIIKIAQYFGVSTDYILGLSDAETNNKDVQFICDYTGLSEKTVLKLHEWSEKESSTFEYQYVKLLDSIVEIDTLLDIIVSYKSFADMFKSLYEGVLNGEYDKTNCETTKFLFELNRDTRLGYFQAIETFRIFLNESIFDFKKICAMHLDLKEYMSYNSKGEPNGNDNEAE